MRKAEADQKMFGDKLREAVIQTSYWPRTWRLIWAAAPRQTLAWATLLVVQGVLPVAIVYLSKLLVDSLVATVGAGGTWEQAGPTLMLVALMAGLMLTMEVLQSVTEWVRTAQSELIQDHIKGLVHKQSTEVDMACYESWSYFDRLDQARNEAASRPLALLESGGSLVQNGITLVAMAAVLIPYSPWLPVVLLIGTLPALFVVLRFDRRYHRWWERTTNDRRWAQYYDMLLTDRFTAAEVRLFGLAGHVGTLYQAVRQRLRADRFRLLQQQSLARLGAGALTLLVAGGAMAWMVWRALNGFVSLGDLALFYQAFTRSQGLARTLLGNLGQIYSNTLFLGNLFSFLSLKPDITDPPSPVPVPRALKQGITFRNVTFRYPGSEHPALDDFSLSVPAGKVVAIVGPNGAGKTSLLKLLCRFYDPEAGRIELDGIDLREFAVKDLRRQATVLFQFPVCYVATARQNVAFGDLEAAPGLSEVEAAARSAGADELIERLPFGYDTLLGKGFAGGAELSGGEWQRVAMARAYLRQAPIILLDEPTSFMDSWAEAEWFERFRALARGRTAIIITHRFTIAMRAEIIHVLDRGRIVESGSHHSLLAVGGRYAESWTAQMEASASASAGATNGVMVPTDGLVSR
jgi:ATP-binding cassette subfamily B protein